MTLKDPLSLKESPKYKNFKSNENTSVISSTKNVDKAWLICSYFNRFRDRKDSIEVTDDNRDLQMSIQPQAESVVSSSGIYQANTQQKHPCVPSWAAYNSMVSKADQECTTICAMPLIASPAHEWNTLLTVLMQAQHLNTQVVGPEAKTIITLDMDLYMRALKLQSLKPHLKDKWILRIGEFHTVLCTLWAIGSSIENSGIDDAWVEASIYSPVTTRQILEGKHMKRALNAHITTLNVLFDLLFDGFLKEHPNLEKELKEDAYTLADACVARDKDQISNNHNTLLNNLESHNFQEKLTQFSEERSAKFPMFKVACMYMEMVSDLLLFIRATRQGLWLLHLSSLEKLCPYFFSQGRMKYAQYVPEYIAKMYELQHTDPLIWNELNSGHFCVNKSTVPFCSLGVDHALEQVNKTMKVLGGIRGITQKPMTLARFFLVAPELARLSAEAEKLAGITKRQRVHHHELSKSAELHCEKSRQQLCNVLHEQNPFSMEDDCLMNLITKCIMPENVKKDILRSDVVGEQAYQSFVSEHIIGEINLWERMPKVKLERWSSATKCSRVKVINKTVELKENRSLFARMAIVAQSRPEINIEEAIGTYEFSCISRALFASDGSLLPCVGKSKLMQVLEKEATTETSHEDRQCSVPILGEPEDSTKYMVAIVDAMVIVQEIASSAINIKTCKDFAAQFVKYVEAKTNTYNEVHVIFDHYDVEVSLKQGTRNIRSGGKCDMRSYSCSDTTPIVTSLKQFLSSTKTKDSLTLYLGKKLLDYSCSQEKVFVVSNREGAQSHQIDVSHLTTNHEEADTIMLLHALDVANPQKNSSYYVTRY